MSAYAVARFPHKGSFTQHILRENNFVCVRYWLNELTGRKIEDFERFTIQSRLAPTARVNGFANVNEYIEYLAEQTTDFSKPCWQELLDVVLETDSRFRREARHFSILRQIVLPFLPPEARLLSAGCGAGEEAFDLAFESAEYFGIESDWLVDGIDIRKEAIEKANIARWQSNECSMLPDKLLDAYFEGNSSAMEIIPAIRRKVSFSCGNLLHSGAQNQYHVILCRNLIMDLEKHSGQRLVNSMMQALKPGGYLLVSHNENLQEFVSPESLLSPHMAYKI